MPDDDDTLDPTSVYDPGAAPPAAPAVAQPPAPVVAPPAPAAVVAPPAPPAAPARRSNALSDEEKARLNDHKDREKRRLLREEYGTDDEAEVARIRLERKKKLDEHDALVAAEAERKRSQMSEVEQLQAEVASLKSENEDLKRQLAETKKDVVAKEQDSRIQGIAIKHVRLDRVKYAKQEFREYVVKLTDVEKRRLNEVTIDKWFKKFATDNPDMALGAPAAPPPAATPPVPAAAPPAAPAAGAPPLRRVLPAGGARPVVPVPRQAAPADPFAGKTMKPGLPNSMTPKEVREYAKSKLNITMR